MTYLWDGPLRLPPFGMRNFFSRFITRKWKPCAIPCQICDYFFREYVLIIAPNRSTYSAPADLLAGRSLLLREWVWEGSGGRVWRAEEGMVRERDGGEGFLLLWILHTHLLMDFIVPNPHSPIITYMHIALETVVTIRTYFFCRK